MARWSGEHINHSRYSPNICSYSTMRWLIIFTSLPRWSGLELRRLRLPIAQPPTDHNEGQDLSQRPTLPHRPLVHGTGPALLIRRSNHQELTLLVTVHPLPACHAWVFNLHTVWLKLLIPWRFFRLWALVNELDAPENMVRCMSDNYSTLAYWRFGGGGIEA